GAFGTYTVQTTISDGEGGTAVAQGTATIAEPDIAITPITNDVTAGADFSGSLASFTDPNGADLASDFTVMIDWGDGTSTPGTVTQLTNGFSVNGSHSYVARGTFPARLTITGNGPKTFTAASNFIVSEAPITLRTTPIPAGVAVAGKAFTA